jgi:predicted Zn-dependent peptidase
VDRPVPADAQPPGTTVTLLEPVEGGAVRRTILPGGLRVVTESMPTVRSVSFGVWVGVGSRDETPAQAGASHYLEHLLFKGTKTRSALELSATIDRLGGEMNAFTTKEYTCFYARVLDSDLATAVDIVTDLITSATLHTADVESERGVILEEIAMHDDDATDVVHDDFARLLFGDQPLGRPVLGTVGSIRGLPPDTIARYYRRWYRPEHLVVAAAGNLDHDEVVAQVAAAFDRAAVPIDPTAVPSQPRAGLITGSVPSAVGVVERPTEQANLVLGFPGLARTDERRYTLSVLNAALGGGMSSRLFQEVREKRGLAYSVYSYNSQFADAGMFGIYAGCLPNKVDDVLALCREQLDAVVHRGISDEELDRGKGQMRGGLVLGLEDTGSRMSRIGKAELVYGELLSVEELLAKIDAVTPHDIREVARAVLGGSPSLAVIGPFAPDRDFSRAVA